MSRPVTLILAMLLLLLASQRLFVRFDQEVGRRFDGNEVHAVTEECGRAFNILFGDASDLAGKGANFAADCRRASRTRTAEALFLVVGGGVVLAWGIWVAPRFTRKPIHEVVRKIPSGQVEVTGRRRPDQGQGDAGSGDDGEGP
jgi:hypothetical protein